MLNLGFINEALQNLVAYFYTDQQRTIHTYWFKKALYVYVIIKCLYWLAYFPVLFGANSIFYHKPAFIGVIKNIAWLLPGLNSSFLNAVFIVTLLLICCFKLFYDKIYFIPEFIAWLLTINIHNTVYASNTGGDLLTNQLLLFNCFLSARTILIETKTGQIKLLVHNLAVVAVMVQLCVAYFLSAVAKVADPDWQNGNAIAIVSMTKHFSMFHFPGYYPSMHWIYALLNYVVLFYQAAFPVMVWLPYYKRTFLITGLLMHLYIGVVMGLPAFATIMILAYIFFWPFKKAGK